MAQKKDKQDGETGLPNHGPLDNDLLIRGGRVIDPANGIDGLRDVLVSGGRIAAVAAPGKSGFRPGGIATVFDATGLCVAPGFIDMHVHLREPGQSYKESIATGTAAAAAGGFTSVCTMPNTIPVNDSPEITTWLQDPQRRAQVNVFPVAAATIGSRGDKLSNLASLRQAGAIAVSDDGRPILGDDMMEKVLRGAGALGMPVVQHAEDTRLTAGAAMNEGAVAFRLGLRGMPAEAESRIVERDIALVRRTGAQLHVAHISTAAALQAVRRAKAEGLRITCEVTPHHFALRDDALLDPQYREYEGNLKMNPPLRSEADRQAMVEGLADGAIDAIATDHAPHAVHEKQVEFESAAFGITGVESALGLAISRLHQQPKISLLRIVELLATAPARIFHLDSVSHWGPARGALNPGWAADITIFDPGRKWTFRLRDSLSKSKNSPFDGWELAGKAVATIVAGRVAYREQP